jgi:5-methylcytosine-specific restriction enzyme A
MAKNPRLKTLGARVQTLNATRVQPLTSAGSWRAGKDGSTARGYGYRWQRARDRFLREHPLCVECKRDGRPVPAVVVDHIVPHRGDQDLFWDELNWQPLCKPHHDAKTQQELAEERGGGSAGG